MEQTMKIAWRWVLPVVPLIVLFAAGYEDYARDRENPHMQYFRAHYGETFGCVHLWASKEVYEDDKKNGWGGYADCFPPALAKLALLLNFPATIFAVAVSLGLLTQLDIPMAATFYGAAFASSFVWWYAIGGWIERRRAKRQG
jgi:hypothetical protein